MRLCLDEKEKEEEGVRNWMEDVLRIDLLHSSKERNEVLLPATFAPHLSICSKRAEEDEQGQNNECQTGQKKCRAMLDIPIQLNMDELDVMGA